MNKMPAKVKLLLGAMLGAAVLIIAGFFINLNGLTGLGANILQPLDYQAKNSTPKTDDKNEAVNTAQKSDIDKDGLPDEEEPLYRTDPLNPDTDGDGFLDGEEVAAGCSPISASPKDCEVKGLKTGWNKSKINLTEYFSSLIIGGLLSGDLNKSNPDFQKHIEKLADETSEIQKAMLSIDSSILEVSVSNDNSKNSSQKYLNILENTLAKYFFKKGAGIDINNLSKVDFSPYLDDLDNLYKELAKLESPASWLEIHKKLLKFVLELRVLIYNLEQQEEDPIKAYLTMKNAGRLFNDYEKITAEILTKIENNNLKTNLFNL